MNSPVTPPSLSPEEKVQDPLATHPGSSSQATGGEKTWPEQIFQGRDGLRIGWRMFVYLGVAAAIAYALLWVGKSFFPDTTSGVARLWQEMYGEVALLAAAIAPAFLMGNIEQRPFDDYGLPR